MWWTLVTLALLVPLGAERIVDWEHLRNERAERKAWRAALKSLGSSDRRKVVRAVRAGRAVDEPRLAPAAVSMARAMIVMRVRRPLRWMNLVLGTAWFATPAVFAAVRHRWLLAAFLSAWPVLLITVVVLGPLVGRRADDALTANRRLVDEPPSSTFPSWY